MAFTDFDSRLLTTREEYIEFLRNSSGKPGPGKIDLDWLSKQQVYGIYIDGKLQGGFVYEAPPLSKTFQHVPQEERESLLIKHCSQTEGVVGLTCFWYSKTDKANLLIKYAFASVLASLILKKRRFKYIFFSSGNSKLNALLQKSGVLRVFFKPKREKSSETIISTYVIKTSWFNLLKFVKFMFIKPSWV
jgi:hypothetical protein